MPVGVGYEQVVAALGRRPGAHRGSLERDREPRQFIFGDGAGGVERIRVDFSGPHLEHLRNVLDTTPGGAGADAKPSKPGASVPKQEKPAPRVPVPPEDEELEHDFELAAELEVGLTEDQLLAEPVHKGQGEELSGELHHDGTPGNSGTRGGGKGGGTGRDAA